MRWQWVCIWSGGTTFAHEMAPAHLKSTAQGVLNSVYGAVGASSGLLLGGWLYQHWGPIEMFELQAAGIGGTCAVYVLRGGGAAPRAAEPAATAARVGRGGGADAEGLGQQRARERIALGGEQVNT